MDQDEPQNYPLPPQQILHFFSQREKMMERMPLKGSSLNQVRQWQIYKKVTMNYYLLFDFANSVCENLTSTYLIPLFMYSTGQKALLWNKTTLITGGVGGAGVDPPFWKNKYIFSFKSLALIVPIYRNFQSNGANGAKSRSLKH